MRKDLRRLAVELQARPIQATDIQKLREHAAAAKEGALLADEYKEKEYNLIYPTFAEAHKKYPEKEQQYVGYCEKFLRDMKLVYRYCVYSIVLADPSYHADRMNIWFRTIINAFGFGSDYMTDCYEMLKKRVGMQFKDRARPMEEMIDATTAVWRS